MHCDSCGAENETDAAYCTNCGTQLSWIAPSSARSTTRTKIVVGVLVAVLVVGVASVAWAGLNDNSKPYAAGFFAAAPNFTLPTFPSFTIPDEPTSVPAVPGCPSGKPAVTVTEVSSTAEAGQLGVWLVHVKGTVTNTTTASILVGIVNVRVPNQSPFPVIPNQLQLDPGKSETWTSDDEAEADSAPTIATAEMIDWSWADADALDCPAS